MQGDDVPTRKTRRKARLNCVSDGADIEVRRNWGTDRLMVDEIGSEEIPRTEILTPTVKRAEINERVYGAIEAGAEVEPRQWCTHRRIHVHGQRRERVCRDA